MSRLETLRCGCDIRTVSATRTQKTKVDGLPPAPSLGGARGEGRVMGRSRRSLRHPGPPEARRGPGVRQRVDPP